MNWRNSMCALALASLAFTGWGMAAGQKWSAKAYLKVEAGRAGREKIRLYTPGADGKLVGHDGHGVQVCDNTDWERTCEWFVPIVDNRKKLIHITFRLEKSGLLQDDSAPRQIMVNNGNRRLEAKTKPVEGTDGRELEVIMWPK
jgi:hypothetical protein